MHRRLWQGFRLSAVFLSALLTVTGLGSGVASAAPPPGQGPDELPEQAARRITYAGLRRATPGGGPCKTKFELPLQTNGVACTHGRDPAPEGVDVRQPAPIDPVPSEALAAVPAIPCQGDGTSGPRVQLVYARAASKPDRYDSLLNNFRLWAAQVNDVVNQSAAETGGVRHVRFVHDASCQPTIERVQLTEAGDDSLTKTINELRSQGHNRSDRKYLVWADANVYCGIAQVYNDDRPGSDNPNNGRSDIPGMVGRVDTGCWGLANSVEAHELVHTMGGVQPGAPNSTPAGHCKDDHDRMCYVDAQGVTVTIACAATSHENRLDCNHDDYFSTSPPAGSWLATHWNVANSSFLASTGTASTKSSRFVQGAFQDLLARPPTPAELARWAPLIDGGADRADFAAELTTGQEYRRLWINKYYERILGRPADQSGLDALMSLLGAGWSLGIVPMLILGSEEFFLRIGATNEAFVDTLYREVLGWSPDPSGRLYWTDQLRAGMSRYVVAQSFTMSVYAHQHTVNLAYNQFLDRPADAGGVKFWTDQLSSGLIWEYLYAFLIGSPEYWAKF